MKVVRPLSPWSFGRRPFPIRLLTLSTLCSLWWTSLPGQDVIEAKQFARRLGSNGVQLLDVRTPSEFSEGHILRAVLANWYDHVAFESRIAQLKRDAPVLLYCRSGVRSAEAKYYLLKRGFKHVADLKGGLLLWEKSGLPIIK